METKKLILIGAGMRGRSYTKISLDTGDRFKVVAVAEPVDGWRELIKERHSIADDMCFESYEPIFEKEKFADAVIIATMDRDHLTPTLLAIEKGYDILLEKPIAPTAKECKIIVEAAKKKGVKILVCHVLRFTPFFRLLKKTIDDGVIGDVMSIQHAEHVGNIHYSHSFVRGNWCNSDKSSPMLLQKSCHDLDILQWLVGKPCKRIHSFGSLSYFKSENAPEGAPNRCIEGCKYAKTCCYNSVELYLNNKGNTTFRSVCTKKQVPTDEEVKNALLTTDYGRCVFRCNNNVVDHQVVNMEFDGGVTVSFSMEAFNKGSRNTRIMGTKGEIIANLSDTFITIYDFEKDKTYEISTEEGLKDETIAGGHGGGDTGIVYSFYDLLTGKEDKSLCDVSESAYNHMLVFAAEKSRLEGIVVDVDEFIKSI